MQHGAGHWQGQNTQKPGHPPPRRDSKLVCASSASGGRPRASRAMPPPLDALDALALEGAKKATASEMGVGQK